MKKSTLIALIALLVFGCEDEVPGRNENCSPNLDLLESFLTTKRPYKQTIGSRVKAYLPLWDALDTLKAPNNGKWIAHTVGISGFCCEQKECRPCSNSGRLAFSGDTLRWYDDWPQNYYAYRICSVDENQLTLYDEFDEEIILTVDTSLVLYNSASGDSIDWQPGM